MDREDVDASTVLGPFLVGYTFSVILLGLLATQAFLYYVRSTKDKIWVKTFVAGLCIANAFNPSFNLAYMYRTLIKSFGDQGALGRTDWSIVSAVGGILDAHELAATPNFSYLLDARRFIPVTFIGVKHQHMRQFPKNITLYDHFLRAFIQTGLVLPIGGILGMILYFSSQRTGLYMLYSLPVSKVYSTTLMCCLNTRDGWNFKGYIDESAYSQQDDDILKPGEVLQFAPSQTTMTVTDTIF
ncbi:hypothetical protein CPC08DRAFT_722607 [Agrocybe pediades]|nr:hypothetical protein CPC08DRAFT_722607 [Agrocybe pediades]